VKADLAFPCATQNELSADDAGTLISNGLVALAEGANMPCDLGAQHLMRTQILYGPGKASNAGGVAVSGMEQSQNSLRVSWTPQEVDDRLQAVMRIIYERCSRHGRDDSGHIDYVRGANMGGFIKAANALKSCGII